MTSADAEKQGHSEDTSRDDNCGQVHLLLKYKDGVVNDPGELKVHENIRNLAPVPANIV